MPVNKRIAEFSDTSDVRTPVNAFIAFVHLVINGKNARLAPASSARLAMFLPGPQAPDAVVAENTRSRYLNRLVFECVTYKDSIACVISQYADSLYSMWFFSFEGGRWTNAGEDLGNGLTDSRRKFTLRAGTFLDYARRIGPLSRVSTDTTACVQFLSAQGRDPKHFVLDALAHHRLVVFGELHRRLWSWDLCKSVLNDPAFPRATGTVFMEISAHTQTRLDAFLAKDTLDEDMLLDVFREIQINGWPDRGMFEFTKELWKLNRTLPAERRVRIVAVDIPRPFSTLATAEEKRKYFESAPDRNEHMASAIVAALNADTGSRGSLFIVGVGHAFRSTTRGFASAPNPAAPGGSAGSLLSQRLPRGQVFTIFTHCPVVDNAGRMPGRIRNGLFDHAFRAAGNRPVAFTLHEGPFGKEPFDALPEISFFTSTGTFADNYDGYVFLGPLDEEPGDYLLYDLFSDGFVRELERRAALDNTTVQKWFGVSEVSRRAIIVKLKQENEGRRKWQGLPPL
jgi:hypothetical protein